MSIDRAIAFFKARQAALFDTTVTVARYSAAGTFDPVTATYAEPTATIVYTGAALVRPQRNTVADAGEISIALSSYDVKLPVDTPVAVGDTITVTASRFAPLMVGIGLRVVDVVDDEWQICRRVTCEQETPRPL